MVLLECTELSECSPFWKPQASFQTNVHFYPILKYFEHRAAMRGLFQTVAFDFLLYCEIVKLLKKLKTFVFRWKSYVVRSLR